MRKAPYWNKDGKIHWVEYDDNAPCLVCGEPVIGASMGGTRICGHCDCGNCRYCGRRISLMDKEQVLNHMKNHKDKQPELVKLVNLRLRRMIDKLCSESEERRKKEVASK